MRKLYWVGALCLAAATASATDVGIGLSVKSNDASIYVPVDISPAWRVEPYFNYADSEQESTNQKLETTNYLLGVGVFGKQLPMETIQMYYGARVAYIRSEATATTGIFPVSVIETENDGYRIAPTFGFEYLFNAHISLGGEVAWAYTDQDNVNTNGTSSNVILRYKF